MALNRWLPAVLAAAGIVLASGCAGGSTSSLVPGQSGGGIGQSTSRLQATSAPTQQVRNIESRDAVGGTPQDPLANWTFLEPLAVTDSAAFSVPPRVTKCSVIDDPIFGGLWYISLSNFSAPLSQIQLPSCTLPATASSIIAANYRSDAIAPAGNGNIYIVEIDVGIISLATTPIAGPASDATGTTFVFGNLESDLTFQKDHLYAFFLAEYTGTGQPTTVSI